MVPGNSYLNLKALFSYWASLKGLGRARFQREEHLKGVGEMVPSSRGGLSLYFLSNPMFL